MSYITKFNLKTVKRTVPKDSVLEPRLTDAARQSNVGLSNRLKNMEQYQK